MVYASPLPDGYSPPEHLTLCSNVLHNVQIPLAIDGTPVLLIGKGRIPLVWLAAPIGGREQRWVHVVRASQATNPGVIIRTVVQKALVEVNIGGLDVIRAQAVSPEEIVVDLVDLRPIGLAIHGDQAGLSFSGALLAQNTFENLTTAFASGSAPSP